MYIVSGLIVTLHTFTKIVVNRLLFSVMKIQLIKVGSVRKKKVTDIKNLMKTNQYKMVQEAW